MRAAIAAGVHYVDVSGEQDHLARTFAEADAPARAFDQANFLDALAPYGVRWSVSTDAG